MRGAGGWLGVAAGVAGFVATLAAGHLTPAWVCAAFALLCFCFATRLALHWQILIGTVLGVGFGLWLGAAAEAMADLTLSLVFSSMQST